MKTACFVIVVLLFCITARAETYLFVGSNNFSVLSEQTEDGENRGLGVDIARIIGQRLGHTVIIRLYPWARAMCLVKTGKADVLIAPHKTSEREKWLDYTKNYFFVNKTFFYVRPGSNIQWNGDLSSLKGKKIGLPLEWSSGPVFDEIKHFLTIDYAPTIDMCFTKLLLNRVDLVPSNVRETLAAFERLGISSELQPVPIRPQMQTTYNYFGFSRQKNLSDFRRQFDKILGQMIRDREISRLFEEKYGILHDWY